MTRLRIVAKTLSGRRLPLKFDICPGHFRHVRVGVLAGWLLVPLFILSLAPRARAETLPPSEPSSTSPRVLAALPGGEGACAFAPADERERGIGLEANVLWPFFPGGIFELRLMVPVVRTDRRDWRGELVIGAYSDFASRVVRGDDAGKVANLSGKLGYRQFLVYGLHVEASANIGWRHESDRPPSGGQSFPSAIDGLQARLWVLAGYQHEFSRALYANVRGGVGVNVYRSDAYANLEKAVAPGGDVNVGVRF